MNNVKKICKNGFHSHEFVSDLVLICWKCGHRIRFSKHEIDKMFDINGSED